MQVIGDRHGDRDVLAASAAIEDAIPWAGTYPPDAIGGAR